MRTLTLVFIVLLLTLQYQLWFSSGGIAQTINLNKTIAIQSKTTLDMQKRNQQLAAQVEDLKNGSESIEALAREELGMIKPGEVYYQLLPPATATS